MTVLLVAPAVLVAAQVPPQQTLWANVDADRGMVADPLWGLEPGSRGELAALLADDVTGAASVGKSWTLHMAIHALRVNLVEKLDVVTVSADAASRPCNCFNDTNNVPIAAGERAFFWDLVLGMHVVSSNSIAQAVAEHIGQALKPSCQLGPYPSECLQVYLDWANWHAWGVGVSHQTLFDKSWTLDQTTARDVLRWWVHALEDPDPEFLEVAGWTGSYQFTTLPPFSKTYAFGQGPGNYTGWEAHKLGSNTLCNGDRPPRTNACLVSSATRIGRRVVSVHMQSNVSPDRTALLDYGFAKTFHPEPAGVSEPWAPVAQHDLACVSGSKAVSALVRPGGTSRLVLWDVDMEAKSITTTASVNPVLLPGDLDLEAWVRPGHTSLNFPPGTSVPGGAHRPANDALAGLPDPEDPRPFRVPVPLPPGPGFSVPDTVLGQVQQVAIAPLTTNAVVVAHRGVDAVRLSTWGIAGAQVVPLGSTVFPAHDVTKVHLEALDHQRFVLALQKPDDDRVFHSWLAHGDGSLELVHAVAPQPVEEFDLAVQTHLGSPLIFVAARALDGSAYTEAWRMGADGTLQLVGNGGLAGSVSSLAASAAPVEPLAGEFVVDPHFAMVYRNALGQGRVAYWKHDGVDLVLVGLSTVASDELPQIARFDLSPLGSSGLLLGKSLDGSSAQLEVLESRRDPVTGNVAALSIVENDLGLVEDFHGMCKVPRPVAGAPSEGDYLVATDEFFEGSLQVSGWRSGELPH